MKCVFSLSFLNTAKKGFQKVDGPELAANVWASTGNSLQLSAANLGHIVVPNGEEEGGNGNEWDTSEKSAFSLNFCFTNDDAGKCSSKLAETITAIDTGLSGPDEQIFAGYPKRS